MNPTSLEDVFVGAILKEPVALHHLAYADWLAERGRDDEAFCLRWMGRRNRRPHRRLYYKQGPGRMAVPEKASWGWYRLPTPGYRGHEFNPVPCDGAWLPRTVFAPISSADHWYGFSWRNAVCVLSDALKQVREDLE